MPQTGAHWDLHWRFVLAVLVHNVTDTERLDLATFEIDMQSPETRHKTSGVQSEASEAGQQSSRVFAGVGPYVL